MVQPACGQVVCGLDQVVAALAPLASADFNTTCAAATVGWGWCLNCPGWWQGDGSGVHSTPTHPRHHTGIAQAETWIGRLLLYGLKCKEVYIFLKRDSLLHQL